MMADKLKFAVALLLLVAGIAGFYLLAEQPLIVRVLAVLAGVAAGAGVAWFTEPGQRFFSFSQEAVTEAKKVAWPTRKETMQTSVAVFGFVIVMGLVLYIADKSLEWVLYDLILGWK
jgi:preprotein translocase subunit SecE